MFFAVPFSLSFLNLFLLITYAYAYIAKIKHNMSFDKSAFIKEFAYPMFVSVLSAVVYEAFDVASTSTARRVYGVRFANSCDGHGYNCTIRAHYNQIEQIIPFLISLWACALTYDATMAGHLGLAWVIVRFFYGFFYRGITSSIKVLLLFTVPGYLFIIAMASLASQEVLRELLGEEKFGDKIGLALPLFTFLFSSLIYQPILKAQLKARKEKDEARQNKET